MAVEVRGAGSGRVRREVIDGVSADLLCPFVVASVAAGRTGCTPSETVKRQPVDATQETDGPGHQLKRDLRTRDLIVFGVGVIVGTGIFVLTGQQAALHAGPAVVLSFQLAGITCAFAALSAAVTANRMVAGNWPDAESSHPH